MRATVIGAFRLSGIGKESGNAFDFGRIVVLRPAEPVATKNFRRVGFGFETSELDLSVDAVQKFESVRFPAVLDLSVDTVPGRQGLRSVVVGFRPVTDVKAA